MKTTRSTLLILALSALAIGLVIVLGVRLDRVGQEEIVTRFSQRQLLLAEQAAAGIQSIVDEARRDLKGAPGPSHLIDALATESEEEIATWRGACEQGFLSYLHSQPIYAQIRYIDASGQEIVGVDTDGETVRVIPQDQLRSQAERKFFVATMQLDEEGVYVSPLEPALGHGGVGAGLLTVRLATPVFDSQGRRAGIVVLNLMGDEIRARVTRLSAEEGVDAWLLDEAGVEIINVTHPELEGNNAYEYCQQTGDETLVALAEDMLTGGRGTGTYLWPESEGGPLVAKKLMAYAPVYPAEGQVWSVGTSVPYDSILAAHRQTHRMLLFLGGDIVTIILAGAVLAARSGYKRVVAEEQAHLSGTLRRRGEELEALREISLAISTQLELDELLQNIVEQGCHLLDIAAGCLYLVDQARGDLELIVDYGYTMNHIGTRMAPGEGTSGKVLQSGETLIVDDYHHWEGRAPGWEAEPITTNLGVPLKRGEQIIGALVFDELAKVRRFDEHDVWLATLFANQATIAIENARLYRAEQAARERADTLREISRVVGSTLELDEVLSLVLRQAKRVLTYDTASILLFASGEPTMAAVAGYEDEELVKTEASLRLDDSPILQAMARDHRPTVIGDVREDERWIWVPGAEDIRAWIGAPLLVRDEMIGALMIDSAQPGSYTAADAATAQALANQAAVAIENARLYEQAQRRLESLTNLNRASQVVTSSLDVKEVLEQIVDLAGSVVNSDYTSVVLLDEEGEPVLGTEDFRGVSPVARRIRSDGVHRHVLDSGQPVIVDTISAEGAMSPPLRRPDGELMEANPDIVAAGIRSFAAVPIQARGKMLGVTFVHSREPRAFQGRLPLLTTFANQAAVAIENARLFEAEQRRRQEAETLREAALALTTSLDRNQVIERILIQLRQVVPYDSASVQLLHDGHLEIIGGHGFPNLEELLGVTFDLAAEDNPNCEVMRTRAFLILEDAPAAYGGFSREPHAKAAIRSWLGVPMLVGEQPVGMIALDKREPGFYIEEHARLAQAFAAQAGIAIENARLFEAEREQRELAEALEEAAAAVSSTLHLDQVLDRILEQVERVVAGDAFNIMLLEDSTARVIRWRGYEHLGVEEQIASSTIHVHEYPNLVRMMQAGKPVVIPDTAADPAWVPKEGQEWRRSYVAAPIRVKDLTVGFLNVVSTHPGQFGSADARRLETFADHAAPAIENARLYQEMLNYADQLEQRVQERTAELQAQYARLDVILRSASDGIVVTDGQGEILRANPVAQTWLTQTLSPEDAARMRETVRDLARRADERPEAVLELKGLDLELKAAPIPEPGEKEAAAVVAVHDVSHLKALERMKSRFVSNISHKLRTPITTIKLYAALLRKASPGKREGYLETLEQETEQLARLIEDILHISRIDARRLGMEPRPTLLNELTEVAVVSHQTLAQNRGLTLEHRPAEPGPVALADPEQMMQALNNLVVNAIQYTPEGGQVVVSTGKQDMKGRAWATVTVADTGIGIPEEELPHLFERFFRGEEPRLMQMPGSGLGLAIAKEIVELHGGRLTVESQVGKGTTFTIWLPLTDYLLNKLRKRGFTPLSGTGKPPPPRISHRGWLPSSTTPLPRQEKATNLGTPFRRRKGR